MTADHSLTTARSSETPKTYYLKLAEEIVKDRIRFPTLFAHTYPANGSMFEKHETIFYLSLRNGMEAYDDFIDILRILIENDNEDRALDIIENEFFPLPFRYEGKADCTSEFSRHNVSQETACKRLLLKITDTYARHSYMNANIIEPAVNLALEKTQERLLHLSMDSPSQDNLEEPVYKSTIQNRFDEFKEWMMELYAVLDYQYQIMPQYLSFEDASTLHKDEIERLEGAEDFARLLLENVACFEQESPSWPFEYYALAAKHINNIADLSQNLDDRSLRPPQKMDHNLPFHMLLKEIVRVTTQGNPDDPLTQEHIDFWTPARTQGILVIAGMFNEKYPLSDEVLSMQKQARKNLESRTEDQAHTNTAHPPKPF